MPVISSKTRRFFSNRKQTPHQATAPACSAGRDFTNWALLILWCSIFCLSTTLSLAKPVPSVKLISTNTKLQIVSSANRKLKLIIPAGAVSSARVGSRLLSAEAVINQIQLLPLSQEAFQAVPTDGKAVIAAAECKPQGLLFLKPVVIVYTLEQAEVPGTKVELALFDSTKRKFILQKQTSFVEKDSYTVKFTLRHFSSYAVLKTFVSQGAAIGQGVKIPLPDLLTGSFSHSIPLTIPPGRKGVQPQLSLTYRSSNPNSWVGVGFSLNPGYIVRSTRLGPANYTDDDTFYFITDSGTTELVHLTDNLYQAKIESSFTKFFKENDTWLALAKDGSTLKFGQTPESKETSPSGTFSWYLSKAIDTNGNYLTYIYSKDQGKAYLSRIDYTGNQNTGTDPTNSVEFSTESRNDISSSYISGNKISTGRRLKTIEAKVNSGLVWRYELAYSYSDDTNRSLLKSVTQFAADGKSLPTQSFEYQRAK
jgi:hypothetical protein